MTHDYDTDGHTANLELGSFFARAGFDDYVIPVTINAKSIFDRIEGDIATLIEEHIEDAVDKLNKKRAAAFGNFKRETIDHLDARIDHSVRARRMSFIKELIEHAVEERWERRQ